MSWVTYILFIIFIATSNLIQSDTFTIMTWMVYIVMLLFVMAGIRSFWEWVYGNYTVTYSNE